MKSALLGLTISAAIPIVAAGAEPIVFIASWHNLDSVKHGCEHLLARESDAQKTIRELANNTYALTPAELGLSDTVNGASECRSVRDPRELGRRLENELVNALAINTRCGGVTVMFDPHPDYDRYGYSDANAKIWKIRRQSAHWDLHLDHSPGQKTYAWTLFANKAAGFWGNGLPQQDGMVSGEGANIPQVADQICTVVTRQGATIAR